MRDHIARAARRSGITKKLGWHTFRHTFSILLRANEEDVKVVHELLRHASVKITLDVYTQAMTPAKRQAQSRVVAMIRPEVRGNGGVSKGETENCVREIVHGTSASDDAK